MAGDIARRFDRAFKLAALGRMAAAANEDAPDRELAAGKRYKVNATEYHKRQIWLTTTSKLRLAFGSGGATSCCLR